MARTGIPARVRGTIDGASTQSEVPDRRQPPMIQWCCGSPGRPGLRLRFDQIERRDTKRTAYLADRDP